MEKTIKGEPSKSASNSSNDDDDNAPKSLPRNVQQSTSSSSNSSSSKTILVGIESLQDEKILEAKKLTKLNERLTSMRDLVTNLESQIRVIDLERTVQEKKIKILTEELGYHDFYAKILQQILNSEDEELVAIVKRTIKVQYRTLKRELKFETTNGHILTEDYDKMLSTLLELSYLDQYKNDQNVMEQTGLVKDMLVWSSKKMKAATSIGVATGVANNWKKFCQSNRPSTSSLPSTRSKSPSSDASTATLPVKRKRKTNSYGRAVKTSSLAVDPEEQQIQNRKCSTKSVMKSDKK